MPQIIVKGLTPTQAESLAVKAAPALGNICSCPADWFVFDLSPSKFFDENGPTSHWPVVQVWWFKRPVNVQDKVASYLNEEFKLLGFNGSQISFHIFNEADYYEDGQHY